MTESASVELSIVIPVYCGGGTLPELVARLQQVMERQSQRFEVILVDDASPDDSWRAAEELARRHSWITAIQLMRNAGQHNALMCGFRHTRGELVITMDDDLQNPPEEIPKLLTAMQDPQCDMAYGAYSRKKHSGGRNLGSAVVNLFFRQVFRTSITVTSFRIIRRDVLQHILNYDLNFTFVDGLLAWRTDRSVQVPVQHIERQRGSSGYSISKLLVLALNLFTNFSLLPLQCASALGLIASTAGIVCGMYYLALALLHRIAVPGYASMIVAVLILGGVQLLALGVIGEYIGRMHMNLNRKPQYTIRRILQQHPAPKD